MQGQDADDRILRYLDEDSDLARARKELESKIGELVEGAPEQWDLLGYVLTEFEPAVFQANLSAFQRAFFVDQPDDATTEDLDSGGHPPENGGP